MERLYFKEALHHAKYLGIESPEDLIIEKIESWKKAQRPDANLRNLIKGKTKPTPEIVRIFCDVCNVTPNFIYYGPEK